jgi:hypothetical protein
MPYKRGKLKGELTTAEIRKLVRAHNKLSQIKIPPKSSRDDIMKIIDKAGFKVNHEAETLEQMKSVKKIVTLEGAKETTKPVPKTEEQKKQAKQKKEKKEKDVKKREGELIKAGAILGKARAKAQMKKEEPKPKPEPKAKPAKRSERGFKVEQRERSQMIQSAQFDEKGNQIKPKFDPFKILGITRREETPELVKKKCRELRLSSHPDKGGDPEKFKLIQKACKILLDTQTILK